jgi:hypothetical protein
MKTMDKWIRFDTTARGFRYYEFTDRYDGKCSLQESSLATEDAIWLGMNRGTHHHGTCLARMHLTREMVARLLPILQEFVDTGHLSLPEEEDEEK